MSVPVVLAAPGLPGESDLVAALAQPGAQVTVVRRCVDAIDLVGAAASGCAHTAVVGPNLPRLARDTIARLAAARVGVLGVVSAGDEAGERILRDLDVRRVVVVAPGDVQHTVGQLSRAVADAHTQSSPGSESIDSAPGEIHPWLDHAVPDDPGALIAVWGTHGAPGCTSVSIALADEMSRQGHATLLIDADTLGGSVGMSLGMLDEASGIAIACRHADAGTLDAFSLAQAARSLDEGWRVLSGIGRPERWVELRPAALARLWQVARNIPGAAIVDVGCGLEPPGSGWAPAGDRFAAAHSAIEAADALVAVGSADPVGIDRLINGLDLLRQRSDAVVHVVVNRLRRGVLGRDPAAQVREALVRHAGIGQVHFVDADVPAFDAALREGRTLAEVAPRSSARNALRELARHVSEETIRVIAA